MAGPTNEGKQDTKLVPAVGWWAEFKDKEQRDSYMPIQAWMIAGGRVVGLVDGGTRGGLQPAHEACDPEYECVGYRHGAIALYKSSREEQGDRKAELLEHYGQKEPKQFYQFDSFIMDNGGDCVMHPDKDGDCIMRSVGWELMYGSDVRVLIPVCNKPIPQRVVRILRKVAACIERHGLPEVDENGNRPPKEGESPF